VGSSTPPITPRPARPGPSLQAKPCAEFLTHLLSRHPPPTWRCVATPEVALGAPSRRRCPAAVARMLPTGPALSPPPTLPCPAACRNLEGNGMVDRLPSGPDLGSGSVRASGGSRAALTAPSARGRKQQVRCWRWLVARVGVGVGVGGGCKQQVGFWLRHGVPVIWQAVSSGLPGPAAGQLRAAWTRRWSAEGWLDQALVS